MAAFARHRQAREFLVAGFIEEAELDLCGMLRPDGEFDAGLRKGSRPPLAAVVRPHEPPDQVITEGASRPVRLRMSGDAVRGGDQVGERLLRLDVVAGRIWLVALEVNA